MGDAFSAIGTAIRLAEFCLRLKEVSSENHVFLTLISRVRKDLEEAWRERQEKASLLQHFPEKKAWIDDAILDARRELNTIGRLVEDARIDVERGKPVTLKHRFDWVLTNHQKFVTEERALATFHQSLLGAMAAMHNLSVPANISPPPTTITTSPPAYDASMEKSLEALQDADILRSPFRRRPGRPVANSTHLTPAYASKNSSALSLPDIEPSMDDAWSESLLRLSSDTSNNCHELSRSQSAGSIGELPLLTHTTFADVEQTFQACPIHRKGRSQFLLFALQLLLPPPVPYIPALENWISKRHLLYHNRLKERVWIRMRLHSRKLVYWSLQRKHKTEQEYKSGGGEKGQGLNTADGNLLCTEYNTSRSYDHGHGKRDHDQLILMERLLYCQEMPNLRFKS